MKQNVIFQISGMHCTSCAFSIDGELEDTDGVSEAITNYAKQCTEVTFDQTKISVKEISKIIQKTGYEAQLVESK